MSQPLATPTYYQQLGVSRWASDQSIRQAYRQLSKRYHPDTSPLAPEVAIRRFQDIQEAYRILTNPTQRAMYDASLWIREPETRIPTRSPDRPEQPLPEFELETRPFSDGELFVLVLMGATFVACLALVGAIAWIRQGTLL